MQIPGVISEAQYGANFAAGNRGIDIGAAGGRILDQEGGPATLG
jgi:hypothetical protein